MYHLYGTVDRGQIIIIFLDASVCSGYKFLLTLTMWKEIVENGDVSRFMNGGKEKKESPLVHDGLNFL